MTETKGENRTVHLNRCLSANLLRLRGESAWRIRSVDCTAEQRAPAPDIRVGRMHAEEVGWAALRFITPEEACEFLRRDLQRFLFVAV